MKSEQSSQTTAVKKRSSSHQKKSSKNDVQSAKNDAVENLIPKNFSTMTSSVSELGCFAENFQQLAVTASAIAEQALHQKFQKAKAVHESDYGSPSPSQRATPLGAVPVHPMNPGMGQLKRSSLERAYIADSGPYLISGLKPEPSPQAPTITAVKEDVQVLNTLKNIEVSDKEYQKKKLKNQFALKYNLSKTLKFRGCFARLHRQKVGV